MNNAPPLLRVRGLNVSYQTENGLVRAVRDLDFEISSNETLGIVGESGSGKTQTALSVMGLLSETARVSGQAIFGDRDLLHLNESALNKIRGNEIAMIFQDPMTALNPHITIGKQMARVLQHHRGIGRAEAMHTAGELLDAVRIPEARNRLYQYPHEMSGGMRQRVMIATALLCKPKLLIADEPTTALDVTVQAQILQLMQELQTDLGTAILLITHDMGVVAGNCDRVLVMRSGEMQEQGRVEQVFNAPAAEYTKNLLAAVPRLDQVDSVQLSAVGSDLLQVEQAKVVFETERPALFAAKRLLRAVDGVSFDLHAGETLGIVGESGCGKSSLARGVLRLVDLEAGRVSLLGDNLSELDSAALKAKRQQMQVIFQDPLASLNPRMTVGEIIGEPLRTFSPELSRDKRDERVIALLKKVGLKPAHIARYPHEFSGGQCQRIGIARALICEPELVICDEPVSALDVSVQAQIIDLLMEVQRETGLALIFIAHDLAVVRQISHRIMVMYLGRVVEIADRDALYEAPKHPYTRALISSVPIPDPAREAAREPALLEGDLPSPLDPPSGCAFRTRCVLADERCAAERPELREIDGSLVACHHTDNVK